MSISAFTAIVHAISNFENFMNAVFGQMRASLHQRDDLLELRKVSFLLSRKERKPFKERDYVLDDSVDIGYFVIPNPIGSAAKSSTAQVSFEESEDYPILL